jgi:hypothetical protein
VLPELGRDGDINASNGFLNHRSGDSVMPKCLAAGLGCWNSARTKRSPIQHVDVAATGAAILGVRTGEMAGTPIKEIWCSLVECRSLPCGWKPTRHPDCRHAAQG